MNANVKSHAMFLAARVFEPLESPLGGVGDLAVSCCIPHLVSVLWERRCSQVQIPVPLHNAGTRGSATACDNPVSAADEMAT